MEKLLITPLVTPGGIADESALREEGMNRKIMIHGGEGSEDFLQLREGAPRYFHDSCQRLIDSVSESAHALLIGGTTGEGVGLGLLQWQALVGSMKKQCSPEIRLMAGILGTVTMMRDQVSIAHKFGYDEFVLGLNHIGENQRRFDILMSALGMGDKVWLYNMPTFSSASLEFIQSCMEDERVQGIKDSSKGSDPMKIRELLRLKEIRPDFQVLVGNESVYSELSEEDFGQVDGLVSGNSNVAPELLFNFAQNPHSNAGERQTLHNEIESLAGGRKDGDVRRISAHILGLKRRLREMGIFGPNQVFLSRERSDLFLPNEY